MPRRNLSPEEEERIASLYTEGRNSSQIAKELKLAYQTVHRRVLKLKAAEEQSGGVHVETQGSEAPAPTVRKRNKQSEVSGTASTGLAHISTREVYQGELLTFIHDVSGKTVSIEMSGQEPMRFETDVFMMFARDVDRMKTLLSDTNIPE